MMRDKDWWNNRIIYHITVPCFQDSNGDGVGDISGIIKRLDYVSGLGANMIYLSPVFDSPLADLGNDVSNYHELKRCFGTLSDMKQLIQQSRQLDISIVLDFPVFQTSVEHPWFQESRQSKAGEGKENWYIWDEGLKGKVPDHSKSAYGGPAWTWDETAEKFYFHSFGKKQADLNWNEAGLRTAMKNEIGYWLDLGIDGIFLNAYCSLDQTDFKDQRMLQMADKTHLKENMKWLMEEIGSLKIQYPDKLFFGSYHSDYHFQDESLRKKYLQSITTASNLKPISIQWNAKEFKLWIQQEYHDEAFWPVIQFSNSNHSRIASRFAKKFETIHRAKIIGALSSTLKGIPLIYYGEEMGMLDGKRKKKHESFSCGGFQVQEKEQRLEYNSPMQWSAGKHSGFSLTEPWLEVNEGYLSVNAEDEQYRQASLLVFYKKMIAIRKSKPALSLGSFKLENVSEDDIIAFYRQKGSQNVFISINFADTEKRLHTSQAGNWKVVFSTHKTMDEEFISLNFKMMPYEISILEEMVLNSKESPDF